MASSGCCEKYYFIVKCRNIEALKKCYESGRWACRNRVKPPHPHTILTHCLRRKPVILIFSVNNCHGWHGYCEMTDVPEAVGSSKSDSGFKMIDSHDAGVDELDGGKNKEDGILIPKNIDDTKMESCSSVAFEKETEETEWYYFNVQWKTIFLKEFGEQCLSSAKTEHFSVSENLKVNKARNWQDLPEDIGRHLCELIDEHYAELKQQLQLKVDAQRAKQPESFLVPGVKEDSHWYCKKAVSKVEEELGRIHLACPFGSQRYNLHGADSDIDVFIVYQASTKDVLGLNPPKETIKNSDKDGCDYTILELHRYCDLLATGDPRCVETLFLHESSLVKRSQEWRQLREKSELFLTRQCLDKYLRDALGSNGVKQLSKWKDLNPETKEVPTRIKKLVYIIVRLLQNARDIIQGVHLKVFREAGSNEHQVLKSIRQDQKTIDDMWSIIKSLMDEVEQGKDNVTMDTTESKKLVEKWLLQLRYDDFHLHSL